MADCVRRRLWVVTECYPRPGRPGHCAFVHRQMLGLRAMGWEIRVLIPNGWFPPFVWRALGPWRHAARVALPPGWTVDGIPVEDLRFQNRVPSRLSRPLDMGDRIANALADVLGRAGATAQSDLLLCEFALPYGRPVRDAAIRLGLRYAVHLRGDDVWIWPHGDPRRHRDFLAAVRDADLVLSVSRSLLNEAERMVGGLQYRAVVPNGVDLSRFRPVASMAERQACRRALSIGDQELVVICVGDAIVRKGWLDLLGALGGLDEGRAVALVAATSSHAAELDLDRETNRLAPRVRLLNRTDLRGDALADAYRSADIFCLPSHWEGMANALLEAMGCGLPVVTTAVAGHPEVVTGGLEGLLVPIGNTEALTEALRALLDSAELRHRLGAAARERAQAVGDSARAGRRLSTLLEGAFSAERPVELAESDPYAAPMAAGRAT